MYCAKSSCSLSPCNNIARARARATRCAVYAVMITTLQLQLQRRKTASAADDGQIPSMDGNLRVAKWQKGGGGFKISGDLPLALRNKGRPCLHPYKAPGVFMQDLLATCISCGLWEVQKPSVLGMLLLLTRFAGGGMGKGPENPTQGKC